jgi:hypothetical protein
MVINDDSNHLGNDSAINNQVNFVADRKKKSYGNKWLSTGSVAILIFFFLLVWNGMKVKGKRTTLTIVPPISNETAYGTAH